MGRKMELISKTIGEFITENAKRYEDRIAMELGDWSCTFREMDEITDFLALRLASRWGIQKGTHVGIWSVNTPDYLFLFFAMVKIGAIPVPVNTCFLEKEISEILNSMDIKVLFYGKGWKDLNYELMIPKIRPLSPGVRSFVAMETPSSEEVESLSSGGYFSVEDFREEARDTEGLRQIRELREKVDSRDTACIMMTSGTTLLPKGVMLSHFNIVNDGRAAARCMHWSDRDRILLALPFFHCFGLITGAVGAVLNGMQMEVLPHFASISVWDAIDNRGITVLNGVPSIFLALIRKPEYKEKKSDHLTSGIIGGSVLREEDYLDICAHCPKMQLLPSYGMAEGSPSVTFPDWNTPLRIRAESCGKLMEGIEGKILDLHTGEVLSSSIGDAHGQEYAGELSENAKDETEDFSHKAGELCLRGYNIMEAYYNMPEETKVAFTEDGFLRTGDLGYFNEAGELFITGRLKELIIRAGENISVAEIENEILDSGFVQAVKVVGVSSDFRQEEIAALVVPNNMATFWPEMLKKYLAERLAVYKIPDAILPVESLPLTGSGKVDLKESKKMAEEMLKRLRG